MMCAAAGLKRKIFTKAFLFAIAKIFFTPSPTLTSFARTRPKTSCARSFVQGSFFCPGMV